MSFKTIKENGVVVRHECSKHGVFEVGSSNILCYDTRSNNKVMYKRYVCSKCDLDRAKKYYEKNKEARKEYYEKNKEARKEYYEKNKEAICKREKEYYQKRKEVKKEYYRKNKVVQLERQKEYRKKNKEAILKQRKEYYQKNKKEINERVINRIRTDCRIRFINLLRVSTRRAIKNKSTTKMIGCNYDFIAEHLGGEDKIALVGEIYHIDHIYPLSAFSFDESVETDDNHHKMIACNWRNLQLLTKEENLIKGDRLDHSTQTKAVLESFREIGFEVSVEDGKMVVRKC